jgi:hypothetical protein
MFALLLGFVEPFSVRARALRANFYWLLWMCAILGLAGLIGLVMLRMGPSPAVIAWLIFLVGIFFILLRPRYGLYLMMFFGLAGDGVLTPWFPFTKNFSSPESIFFLHNAVIVSPLEVYIAVVLLSWFGRGIAQRRLTLHRNPLTWPILIFTMFILFGLGYGVGKGGNLTIALWEARPLFYLVALFMLTSNLLEKREHVLRLIWAAMLGIFFEAICGFLVFILALQGSLAGVESLTDHSAAIHMNTLFVLALAAWIYKATPGMRIGLPLMAPIVAITYLANQRRAAIVALAVAILLMVIILFRDNRRLFWVIAPIGVIVAGCYLALFWNSGGALGLPARAIKSTLFESQATLRDQASNYYRFLENLNTGFTIHQNPFTGVGFGNKFYVVVSMADISFFEWWEYFPHNSIIWIWLKMGVGGFLAMLFLVGSAIMTGVSSVLRMPHNELRSIALTATLYLVMHFVFAYVDISWDIQSMLYIGTMMGVLCSIERVVDTPVPLPPKRWPWQPDPKPVLESIPLTKETI